MTDMQTKLIEMLEWLHSFCVENNIKYYAIGGTLLGAVRHNGFIPWDDDIDIGMPRNEYNRFIKCMENTCQSKYVLETPFKNKDFVYQYCKLYDTATTLIENTRFKTKRGIFIDVFPLDGAGDSLKSSINFFCKLNKKNNFISTKVCAVRKGRALHKNVAIIISRCIPVNWQKIAKKTDVLASSKNFDTSNYVANFYGNWKEKEIWKREWFGNPIEREFNGAHIYIPKNFDAVLKTTYGNYMQLPPVEKQKTHHDYLFLDLDKSYLHNGEK